MKPRLVNALLLLATLSSHPACARGPDSEGASAAPLFRPAPGSPVRVSAYPADVAVADVNADGRADMVVADWKSGVFVLLGEGRGQFSPASGPLPGGGPAPHLVASGDVDGDRRIDLAVTSHDDPGVAVLLGDGRGGFAPAPGSPFASLTSGKPHNHGLVLADVDGDGRLDAVTSNSNDASVSVLRGDGKGRFAPAPGSPFAVGRSPYPPVLGDVDGDGRLDVVTPDVDAGTLSVLLGAKEGFRRAAGSPIRVIARPYHVLLACIDSGRTLDLVVAHDDVTLVTVLLGDGRGEFRPAPGSPMDVGLRGFGTAAADLDGDGRTDLAIAVGNGAIVLLGDGQGRFAPASGSPFPTGRGAWNLDVADLDRDGAMDLVTSNGEEGTVTVLLGRGRPGDAAIRRPRAAGRRVSARRVSRGSRRCARRRP